MTTARRQADEEDPVKTRLPSDVRCDGDDGHRAVQGTEKQFVRHRKKLVESAFSGARDVKLARDRHG